MQEILLTDDAARRSFLAQYNCTPTEKPPTQSEIILPETSGSRIYETYCTLQDAQRLPLSEYAGQSAVKWTYYLSASSVCRAELICTSGGVLLGAIHYDCTRFDRMYPLIT